MKHALSLAVALTFPMLVSAQALQFSPEILSLEAGVVCPPPAVGTAPAPGTVAGTTHIIEEEPPFVSTARRVPAVIGIGFGIKALAADDVGMEGVTVIVTHPPMGADQIQTQQFGTRISGVSPSITFYQFDYDYELITGQWKMVAIRENRVLYSVTFDVVPASAVPELASVCGYQDLLS